MTIAASQGFKRRTHKTKDAAAQLIRISGEVVTVDEAVRRTGRTRAWVLAQYRAGVRTREQLAK